MSDSWLLEFESRLEQLEQDAATENVAFDQLLRAADRAIEVLAHSKQGEIFLVRSASIERLTATGQTEEVQADDSVREAVSRGSHLAPISASTDEHSEVLYAAHPLADQLTLVYRFEIQSASVPKVSLLEGAVAVASVLGSYISRNLLSQYEFKLTRQSTLVDIISRLSACTTTNDAAAILAHDGASALENCRVTVVCYEDGRLLAKAVTGVSEPKPESESVTATILLVDEFRAGRVSTDWFTVSEVDESSPGRLASFAQSNLGQFRVVPISSETLEQDSAWLVLEVFEKNAQPDDAVVQQLVKTASPVFDRLQKSNSSLLSSLIGSRLRRRIGIAAAMLLVLSFWPADFELEVQGRIEAANQQRVYAPDHGTIDLVRFQNESSVKKGDVLLEMSNPDLELNLQKLNGEVETTTAKLATIRTIRLSGGDVRLSGDEQQLTTELQNLTEERKLVQKQLATLQVMAPFDGVVFLRDPQQELAARPVQRGQLLFEIVPVEGRWQLELDIPDGQRSYLAGYQQKSKSPAPIRYLIRAAPQQDWTTELTSVDNAVQVEGEKLVCRATATLSDLPNTDLRPGTSVVARIYCGRRSLGFVLFREVIEFWDQFRFAWL